MKSIPSSILFIVDQRHAKYMSNKHKNCWQNKKINKILSIFNYQAYEFLKYQLKNLQSKLALFLF